MSSTQQNTDTAIAKFLRRKDHDQVIREKIELKKLKPTDLNQSKEIKLYMNKRLCLWYRGLNKQCKKVWNKHKLLFLYC